MFNERLNSVSNTCQQNRSNAVTGVNNLPLCILKSKAVAEQKFYGRALNNVPSHPHLMMPGSVKCVY